MAFKIETHWTCPECMEEMDGEEATQVREMLLTGKHSQVELRCEDCDVPLTADTTGCEEGEVEINPEWVYD